MVNTALELSDVRKSRLIRVEEKLGKCALVATLEPRKNIEWVREKERTGNVWNFPMWSNTMFTCDTVANLRSKHWTLSLAHDIRACTWGRSNSISLSCELELVYASSFHLFRISLLHLFHLMAFQSLSLTTESHNIRTYKKFETCTVNSANSSCLLSSTFDRIKKKLKSREIATKTTFNWTQDISSSDTICLCVLCIRPKLL